MRIPNNLEQRLRHVAQVVRNTFERGRALPTLVIFTERYDDLVLLSGEHRVQQAHVIRHVPLESNYLLGRGVRLRNLDG